jgi:hypothetical protein
MPDQLSLSLWLHGFGQKNTLRHFRALLGLFPFSRLRPGVTALRIYALEFSEPGLYEQAFAGDVDLDMVVELAAEFEGPDCAYVVDGWWELWSYDNGWQLSPSRVTLTCFGPEFDNDVGDHLRLELGPEALFLPQPGIPEGARKAQSNLLGLVRLAHELEQGLPVERRSLWSESGEDFAERVEALSSELR